MLDDDEGDDLYTADDVEDMLAVAVLKATQRDREELAGLRAALRVAELANLPASIVRKALGPDPVPVPDPAPIPDPQPVPDDDADPDDTDTYDGDPAEDLFAAALEVAEQALADGTDAGPALKKLYELRDDPDALREALGQFAKAWDASLHPRGKNEHFISRDAIADAKGDPAKAEQLREQVKPEDAGKLEDALAGKTDLGTTAKRQAKDVAGERRKVKEAAKADRQTAHDLATKMMLQPKERTADNYHAIIPHLSTMTGAELKALRLKLGGRFEGKTKVSERAQALTEWAKKAALDARMDEQGFNAEEKDAGKGAVAPPDAATPAAEPQGQVTDAPKPTPPAAGPGSGASAEPKPVKPKGTAKPNVTAPAAPAGNFGQAAPAPADPTPVKEPKAPAPKAAPGARVSALKQRVDDPRVTTKQIKTEVESAIAGMTDKDVKAALKQLGYASVTGPSARLRDRLRSSILATRTASERANDSDTYKEGWHGPLAAAEARAGERTPEQAVERLRNSLHQTGLPSKDLVRLAKEFDVPEADTLAAMGEKGGVDPLGKEGKQIHDRVARAVAKRLYDKHAGAS